MQYRSRDALIPQRFAIANSVAQRRSADWTGRDLTNGRMQRGASIEMAPNRVYESTIIYAYLCYKVQQGAPSEVVLNRVEFDNPENGVSSIARGSRLILNQHVTALRCVAYTPIVEKRRPAATASLDERLDTLSGAGVVRAGQQFGG